MKKLFCLFLFIVLICYSTFINQCKAEYSEDEISKIIKENPAEYELLLNEKDPAAICYLGNVFNSFGHYNFALKKFEEAASKNYAPAYVYLGDLYFYGEKVKRNIQKGIAYYEKAAELGHAYAHLQLGFMYRDGDGVKQDLLKAKDLFGKLCDKGMGLACDQYKKLNKLDIK